MNNDEILPQIVSIISELPEVRRIILFGSRAKGNSKYNSDFDIAVDAEGIEFSKQINIKEKIEDVCGLFSFDIIYMNETESGFNKIIENTGKVVYERRN